MRYLYTRKDIIVRKEQYERFFLVCFYDIMAPFGEIL